MSGCTHRVLNLHTSVNDNIEKLIYLKKLFIFPEISQVFNEPTPHRATLGSIRFDQEAEEAVRGNLGQSLYWGFLRKDEASKVNSLGLTSLNDSGRSSGLMAVPGFLARALG